MTVTTTGTKATRVLGALAIAGLVATAVLGLFVTPEAIQFGDTVRLLYIHAPSAWLAYLSYGVTALGSAMYLWRKTYGWDRLAASSAEIGVLFTVLALVTGSIWGRVTWGVYWTWDARLTTTALLLLLFLGYLAVRRLPSTPAVRAKRCAIAGLIAFVDVPIVHQSVEWWRSLHQKATVLRRDLNPEISGIMLFTLFLGFIAFTLVYAWMLMHRARVEAMEDFLDDAGIEVALAERQAEGALS